jgi:aminoglycoside phosphotransferase (APT) family kinase protein
VSETRPVRAGEEIDLVALNVYLTAHAPRVGRVRAIEQFPGGFSNLTYLLKSDRGEVVLRRPPLGIARSSAHDMRREYRILEALDSRGVRAPGPVAYCADESVIGSPFFLMERLYGVILRGVPREAPPAPLMRRLSEGFIDTLVAIHALGRDDPGIAALGKSEGYVERQVSGWTARWQKSRTDAVPEMEVVTAWLAANRPKESGASLVHNDYKYDNLVLDPADLTRVRGVLDWEMATLGDPLLDVGTSLGYWMETGDDPSFSALGLGVTALPGSFSRTEIWERYLEKSARGPADPLFYYVFGLFKIAVIAQQIFFRYRKGLTSDERFARLGVAVQLLARTAEGAMARGVIGALSRS